MISGSRDLFTGLCGSRADNLDERVSSLLTALLRRENRAQLERFRFAGSTNRVYKVPLDSECHEFIIVKLLPGRWTDFRVHTKRRLRNLMYGEHDMSTGRERARLEVERIKEWQAEGLPVPPLIEVGIPDVRVFYGLPYPTFYTVLADTSISTERKLELLAIVTSALSDQHELAIARQCKSLVHRDPGPWNIMVDPDHGRVIWFDLEHPSDYPRMGLDSVMTRALRVFLFGVLHQLGEEFDRVILTIAANYRIKPVLGALITNIEQSRATTLGRLVDATRFRNERHRLRSKIVPALRAALEPQKINGLQPAGRGGYR